MVRGGSASVTSVVHNSGREFAGPKGAKRSICWTAWSVKELSGGLGVDGQFAFPRHKAQLGRGDFAKGRAKAVEFLFRRFSIPPPWHDRRGR